MPNYLGKCHCGTIAFECEGDPIFTQYCHCNKCREIAGYLIEPQIKLAMLLLPLTCGKIFTSKPANQIWSLLFAIIQNYYYVQNVKV